MSLEMLFPNFDELIRTPEDVQRLNETILQLAVQGKLVPQDANDEPARELLKRTLEERKRLLEDKVIGRSGRDVEMDETQISFDVPNQWSWVALADIGYIERGVSFPSSAKETSCLDGHIACLRTTNIQTNVDWSDLIFVPSNYVTSGAKLVRQNDIMISMANSFELVGKVSFVDTLPIVATFGGFIAAFRSIGEINTRYIYLVMKSRFMQEMFRQSSSQTTNIANISLGRTYPLPFPLPPLAEQQRIVAKVDELFAQTRALEARMRQAQENVVTVNRAALHRLHTAQDNDKFQTAWHTIRDHFDVLYDDPRNVAELRQTILDLAVRGKLVPQDANGQPARQSNQRIEQPKKRLPPIDEHSTPFAAPSDWTWEKLGNLAEVVSGVTLGRQLVNHETVSLPYLRVANVQRGYLDLTEIKMVEVKTHEKEKYLLRYGDLLLTEGGDSDKLGRAAIWREQIPGCIHQNHIFRARPLGLAPAEWLMLCTNSPYGRDYFLSSSKKTTNLASINSTQLKNCPIPLPSRQEQRRILAKVDQLMRLCNALEAGLAQTEASRSTLTQAVLHQITT